MIQTSKRLCSFLLALLLSVSAIGLIAPFASASEMTSAIGTVTASSLRLRQGPSTSTATLDLAPYGDAVLVLGAEGDWYKVIFNLQTGYMYKDYLSLDEVKNIQIGNARFDYWTNVRQSPNTSSSILACAPQGSTCFIVGFNQGWFKVTYNGKTGYVRSDLVTTLEIPYSNSDSNGGSAPPDDDGSSDSDFSGKTARFLYYTNVRSGPSTDYSILACAPTGSSCTIKDLKQGWYQINYNGISGYVRSDLVSLADSGSSGGNTTLINGSMSKSEKLQLIFGRVDIPDPREAYSSDSEAKAHMTEITVKTWDLNSSGEKYTRTWSLSVHENVASTVQAIFDEIYALPEKPLIHSLGGYRAAGLSEHSVGLAIDINPNENYYCDPYGNALTGNYFRPDSDPYSIPVGGSIDQIFSKYGFTRGIYWGKGYKDYMHYSLFGT
ncbi:MAG: SH3 domain-containing protein [Oscillospiraceae bacterium]|nr:SH3 domain-containing protein [Oscillospiraceae bacterium]